MAVFGKTPKARAAYASVLYERMAGALHRAHPARVPPPCTAVYNGLCVYGALVAEGMPPAEAVEAAAAQIMDHIGQHLGGDRSRADVH